MLGVPIPSLERLTRGARHRPTGDRDCVAPPRLSCVLGLEESSPCRSTLRAGGRPSADPHYGGRESAVGRAAHPRRIAEARDQDFSDHRGEIPGSAAAVAKPVVAYVFDESRQPDRRRGLLRRADSDVPVAIRAGDPLSRASPRCAHRRHGPSDRGVDGATTPRGISVGRRATLSPAGSRSRVRRMGVHQQSVGD